MIDKPKVKVSGADEEIDYDGPIWDVSTDPDNPQPNVWPKCPTCDTSYIWRRFFSLSRYTSPRGRGDIWAWARDCKHKGAPVIEIRTDG